MAGARTLAMSLNRVIDAAQDARNPRTAGPADPQRHAERSAACGLLSLVSLVVLLVAAWQLNDLCLKLAPLAVAVLVVYPYTKRFTWLSHWVLGLADAIAPMGGWIAVSAAFAPETILLGAAVGVWIAGFDLIYACQDVEFDRREGLHSIPARFGVAASLNPVRLDARADRAAAGGGGAAHGAGLAVLGGVAGRLRAAGLRAPAGEPDRPVAGWTWPSSTSTAISPWWSSWAPSPACS